MLYRSANPILASHDMYYKYTINISTNVHNCIHTFMCTLGYILYQHIHACIVWIHYDTLSDILFHTMMELNISWVRHSCMVEVLSCIVHSIVMIDCVDMLRKTRIPA